MAVGYPLPVRKYSNTVMRLLMGYDHELLIDDGVNCGLRCSNEACTEPVIITEESEIIDAICQHCNEVTPKEIVSKAQQLMNSIPPKLPTSVASDAEMLNYRSMLDDARILLHPENAYLSRLVTAYTEMTHGNDLERSSVEILITVYHNYKRYYPANDRHIGYHLLHLIKALIQRGKRSEAVPFAYEATNIFEISFGIDHPYYLKTLALWTFLDTGTEKKDEELLELMNFNYNRPVDIAPLVEQR